MAPIRTMATKTPRLLPQPLKTSELPLPVVSIDIETTGLNPRYDKIVEIALIKKLPSERLVTLCQRINPMMAIPQRASNIHGITNADVCDEPDFAAFAPALFRFMEDAKTITGYNLQRFDLPFVYAACHHHGISPSFPDNLRLFDPLTVFRKREPYAKRHKLANALQFYCQKPLHNAHSAEADAMAALEVCQAQFQRYPDMIQHLQTLAPGHTAPPPPTERIFCDQAGEVLHFGKYTGRRLDWVAKNDRGYLLWIIQTNFPSTFKQYVQRSLEQV